MTLKEIVYVPEISLELTPTDLKWLAWCSEHHYDGTCQYASQPGGMIYGLQNRLDADPRRKAEACLTFREVDLLAKICETGPPDEEGRRVVMHLYNGFKAGLRTLNASTRKPEPIQP